VAATPRGYGGGGATSATVPSSAAAAGYGLKSLPTPQEVVAYQQMQSIRSEARALREAAASRNAAAAGSARGAGL
jgi:hypothetical protein